MKLQTLTEFVTQLENPESRLSKGHWGYRWKRPQERPLTSWFLLRIQIKATRQNPWRSVWSFCEGPLIKSTHPAQLFEVPEMSNSETSCFCQTSCLVLSKHLCWKYPSKIVRSKSNFGRISQFLWFNAFARAAIALECNCPESRSVCWQLRTVFRCVRCVGGGPAVQRLVGNLVQWGKRCGCDVQWDFCVGVP